jgi:hypothetical protein
VSAVASFVSGRRTKWVAIGLWIVAVIGMREPVPEPARG